MSNLKKRNFVPQAILVTGGCGFVGSNFVNFISKHWPSSKIINFDKLTLGSDGHNVEPQLRSSPRYRLILGDLLNQKLVEKTLNECEIDTIVNFAANSNVDECYDDPVNTTENNVIGMTHLLEACREYAKLKLFFHISSDEVYGDSRNDPDELPKSEDCPLTPTNPYSASKASCEAMLNSYKVSYGLPSITVRMNNIYGPHQCQSKVVPKFIYEAVKGKPFTIMGDGQQKRSWMYVNDACEGICALIEQGQVGEIYNLGTHFELSILELARAIHEEVGKQLTNGPKTPFTIVPVPDRPYNDRRYFIRAISKIREPMGNVAPLESHINKIERDVGWRCKTSFSDGMSKTVAWYLLPKDGKSTVSVLVYGGKGWIGSQFIQYLEQCHVPFATAKSRPGEQPDELVESEMLQVAPTHVVSFIGRTKGPGCNSIEYLEGGSEKLNENIRDNLYAPWILAAICKKLRIHMTYVGTGCIFQYNDEHPIGGQGYTEKDCGNYTGNSYSVVKSFTDRIMHAYSNSVLNVRIRLPVNFELENRNLVVKLASFKKIFDIPDSITVLPDVMPILLDLIKRSYTGTINLTNPGPMRHSETLDVYKRLLDPEKTWDIIDNASPEAEKIKSQRAHCTLDTSLLEELYPEVISAEQGVFEAIVEVGRKMGKLNEDAIERLSWKMCEADHA